MVQQILPTNTFTTAKWIVSATASDGTHTTIATALTSASSGDTIFIRPGTYTENLTLKAGVNLTAFGSDSSFNGTGKVIISGTLSFAAAGSVTISGIQLQTNGATNILSVTGSAASVVMLNNCYLNCTANTGISFTTANTAALIECLYCVGNLGTTGIAFHTMSSTGNISYLFCSFGNTGASSTITSNSAGNVFCQYSTFISPLGTTSTGGIVLYFVIADSSATNTTTLTANGSGSSVAFNSSFSSGSASAVTVGVGASINYLYSNAASSNTNAVTGAGNIQLTAPGFTGSSSLINTTTQSGGLLFGRKDGNAPNPGIIGEQIRSTTGVALTSTVVANITSITLTAGVWDISAIGHFPPSISTTGANLAISTNSASFTGTNAGDSLTQIAPPASTLLALTIPSFRVTISTSTTYFLVASSVFSGTMTASGRISGTRVG